jgi:molybdopterin-guanine dinucleotide biosynthesis protein A
MSELLTVAVLAGGRSSRMGTDKSFVPLLGKTLIQHVLDRVAGLGASTMLVTNRPDDYAVLELPMFTDVLPHRGSLGGLYTALTYSPTPYTLCVACDMPFLNPALLAHLASLREGYDVIVPRIGDNLEALHAVYSKRCLEPIRTRIEQDRLKVIGFYDAVQVQYVEEATIRRFDPDLRSFVNVNTPDELTRWQQAG